MKKQNLYAFSLHLLLCLLVGVTIGTKPLSAQTLEHIRNATSKLTFSGRTFLIDPMLAPRGYYPGFAGTQREHMRNPLVDLPQSTEKILEGVDAVILSHLHSDHWDEFAQKLIDKKLPVLVQNASEADTLRTQGFESVYIIGLDTLPFEGISIDKVHGKHGTDQIYAVPEFAKILGETIGFVFRADGQKTVYFAGDTIWTEEITRAIKRYKPGVIVLNTGYAQVNGFDGSIIMGKDDVLRASRKTSKAKIVAVHMEAVNHCVLSRDELRQFVKKHNLDKRVLVPNDGEVVHF